MQLENAGGTKGGLSLFAVGAVLSLVSAWFFVDSVRVTTYGAGWISGRFGAGGTGSMGVIFLPLFVAVVALFYDATKNWAWGLMFLGVALIAIEILSRLNFWFDLKLSHFLIMLVGMAAGIGLMIRSFREMPAPPSQP